MAEVKINDIQYDTDSMTEEQLGLLNVLQQNTIIANQQDQQIQRVRTVGKVKLEELSKLLDATEKA